MKLHPGLRVTLLADIWDDGQDHHPACFLGHRGDIVVIRRVRKTGDLRLSVSHEGRFDATFVVRPDEVGPYEGKCPYCGIPFASIKPNFPGVTLCATCKRPTVNYGGARATVTLITEPIRMKADEFLLFRTMREQCDTPAVAGYHGMLRPREVVTALEIPPRRAAWLFEKWSARNWYDWGTNILGGWLTIDAFGIDIETVRLIDTTTMETRAPRIPTVRRQPRPDA